MWAHRVCLVTCVVVIVSILSATADHVDLATDSSFVSDRALRHSAKHKSSSTSQQKHTHSRPSADHSSRSANRPQHTVSRTKHVARGNGTLRDFSNANASELNRNVEFFSHIMHTGGTAW